MKSLYFLLTAFAVSACSMNAKSIENTCYAYDKFKDLSDCISREAASQANGRSASYYEAYALTAKRLEIEVRKKKITDEEARLKLSEARIALENRDRAEVNQGIQGMLGGDRERSPKTKPSFWLEQRGDRAYQCNNIGGMVTCN